MKKIWRIYSEDLKKVFGNRVAALIVIVLCILPSLYAWFYLKSSWDPYGHTKGIKVAVVNEDVGAVVKDEFINIGADVVKELKENQDIGWVFVDRAIASEGTRLGKYYANIIIESGFSEKMTTLLDEFPQHPQIRYTVNEKLNAIVPKITDKGASTIKENIQKAFVDTVNRVLMEKLNLIGFDLKNNKENVYSLINFIHDARQSLNQFDEKIDKMLEISYRSRFKMEEIYGELPNIKKNISEGKETLTQNAFLAYNSLQFLETAPDEIKKYKQEIQSITTDIDNEFSLILNKADKKNQDFSHDIQELNPKLSALENTLGTQIESLTKLKTLTNTLLPNSPLTTSLNQKIGTIIGELQTARGKSAGVRGTLSSVQSDVDHALNFGKDTQNAIRDVHNDIQTTLITINEDYEKDIEPFLSEVLKSARDASIQGVEKLDHLEKKLPYLETGLEDGIKILNTEIENIKSFQEKLPNLQGSVGSLDNQFQKWQKNGKLDDLIKVSTLNPERFSDFISDPVKLVENKIFAIPNYGSAMSPFFTTLAIRVGSLLNISLFRTEVIDIKFSEYKNYQKYFGKWLFFLTLALIQSLVVSLGDLLLLGAYAASPFIFVLTAMRTSLVFSIIIYTAVTTFGNIGKALVIVFLVLQLSAAGGTFPVQLSAPFFQIINPFLPFTYAITAMRETIGGIIRQVYLPNIILLIGFVGISILFGLFIKPNIKYWISRFERKFSESGLAE